MKKNLMKILERIKWKIKQSKNQHSAGKFPGESMVQKEINESPEGNYKNSNWTRLKLVQLTLEIYKELYD